MAHGTRAPLTRATFFFGAGAGAGALAGAESAKRKAPLLAVSAAAAPAADSPSAPATPSSLSPPSPPSPPPPAAAPLTWGLVCACNINRSMTAHDDLLRAGFAASNIFSYGAWESVRVPSFNGGALVVPFGTRYSVVQAELAAPSADAAAWVRTTGLGAMLSRDAAVKAAPERWQSLATLPSTAPASSAAVLSHDVVLCFDSHVHELVRQDLTCRGLKPAGPVAATTASAPRRRLQLILLHTRDTIEDARVAGRHAVALALALTEAVASVARREAAATLQRSPAKLALGRSAQTREEDLMDMEACVDSSIAATPDKPALARGRDSVLAPLAEPSLPLPVGLAELTSQVLAALAARLLLPAGSVLHEEWA